MRSNVASRIKLGIVFLLVILIAVLGLTGTLRIGKYRFYPFADFLQPGLDLGGGVSAAGDFLLNAVRDEVNEMIFYKGMPYARIELATMGNDAGIVGAAMLGR